MSSPRGGEAFDRQATIWVRYEHTLKCCRCLSLLSIREQ
jgi:hypothetical protein